MAANYSTGLKNAMADSVGLRGALTGFVIDFYTGARSASADSAPTGSKILRLTLDASPTNYLTFIAAVNGVIAKDPAAIWRGLAVADGVMGYARIKLAADADAYSLTAYRMDLVVAVSGGDLNMTSLTCTASPASPHAIESFQVGF